MIFCLATLLTMASNALAQQRIGSGSGSVPAASQQSGSDATTVFRSARDLITDGEWAKAQEKFSEYVSSYPNEKNIDAALYWLAYTQQKLARYDQCRSTIDRLLEKYPNTNWKRRCSRAVGQVPSYRP
jgi:TolA-binding protein